MKRFVWLVLFAFCTALAQVQPVQSVERPIEQCGCCEKVPAGDCAHTSAKGMKDCVPCCVTCASAFTTLVPAAFILDATTLAEISRLRWKTEKGRILAYPPLLTPPRLLG